MRLFSRASTSGCAVSSPMATSSRPAAERIVESAGSARRSAPRTGNAGMRLDDHALEPGDDVGDLLRRRREGSLRVEEAAGVVQLDLRAGGSAASAARICAAIAPRGTVSSSVLHPQVAHHAAERAFAVGEEDDGGRRERAATRRAPPPRRSRRRACGSSRPLARAVRARTGSRNLRTPRSECEHGDRSLARSEQRARSSAVARDRPRSRSPIERVGFRQPLLPHLVEHAAGTRPS